MFDNVFITHKPLTTPLPLSSNNKVSGMVVDSPEVSVHVCYSVWCHITEDCNLNVLILPAHYSLAVLNKLNV